MKFFPELEEVKKIAADGKYRVLPVSCEMLSDFTTPIETMKILKNVSTHCYMLESAMANDKWGRYTFMGYEPKMEITCRDGEMKAGSFSVKTEDPSKFLRQILADYKSPRFDYLPPFTGGLVGYFSYDYLGYSEPAVRCKVEDTENFKDVDLMLFDKVIAFDHVRQKIILMVNMSLDDVEVGYNKAVMELKQLAELLKKGEKKQEPGGKLTGEVTPLFNREQYCAMVEKAKHYIREGDIFQIVLSSIVFFQTVFFSIAFFQTVLFSLKLFSMLFTCIFNLIFNLISSRIFTQHQVYITRNICHIMEPDILNQGGTADSKAKIITSLPVYLIVNAFLSCFSIIGNFIAVIPGIS